MGTGQSPLDLSGDLDEGSLNDDRLIKVESRENGRRGVGENWYGQLSAEFCWEKEKRGE